MSFGDFFRGRRVLVTGHTGFKGAWLCHWLLQLGADVRGVALPPATDPSLFALLGLAQRMQHHLLDVRDGAALAAAVQACEPEVVFHLAAQSLVRESYRDPGTTWATNVQGTVHLLEALRATSRVQACVIVTSDKCYEYRGEASGYRESDPLGGRDPYSASKAAAELATASFREARFRAGPAVATARAGNVIGGGDWAKERIVTHFLAALAAGQPLALRNPRAVRPWQHVLEPLSGYLTLAARLAGPDGLRHASAWNFGPADAEQITVEQLALLLAEEWGAGEILDGSREDQPYEAPLLALDCSKARDELAWQGLWSVKETVQQTVDWYRALHAGQDVGALTGRQIEDYEALARRRGMPWAR